VGAGLSDHVALITDGRFSGVSHGFIIGHIVPEAQDGGTIALIENGDLISIDAVKNTIQVDLTVEELQKRLSKWVMPAYKAKNGVLLKYIKSVSHASNGCVTDE
jgi:dihydroxy-acid dehydratase